MDALITGLFGGAGATLLWELFFRPARERRSAAEVLSAEVSINLQLLAAARHFATPKRVPPDFSLSTKVFQSVIGKIGELPPKLVGEVVFLYSYFDEINEYPKAYVAKLQELRALDRGAPLYPQVERELLQYVVVFNSYVDKAIARINLVQPSLLRAAFPWWSFRRWRRVKAAELDTQEFAAKLARGAAERSALATDIEKGAAEMQGDGE